MATSFVSFVVCLLISYPFAEQFSLLIQVLAHILTIVFAGLFKVAVVSLMAVSKEQRVVNSQNDSEVALCYNLKY